MVECTEVPGHRKGSGSLSQGAHTHRKLGSRGQEGTVMKGESADGKRVVGRWKRECVCGGWLVEESVGVVVVVVVEVVVVVVVGVVASAAGDDDDADMVWVLRCQAVSSGLR